MNSARSPKVGTLVPRPDAITEDASNRLPRPMIQCERTVTKIKVCLIVDLGIVSWWLFQT